MSSISNWYDSVCAGAYARTRRRLAPSVRNSQYEYADCLRTALAGAGRWLDLGCGHEALPQWMPPEDRTLPVKRWQAFGIDIDEASIRRHNGLDGRVLGNIETLPFADGTFNLITANMVLEHVAHPERLFQELKRVLATDGTLIVHTPNVHGYTTVLTRLIPDRLIAPIAALLLHRRPEDIYPTYYRANSQADLAHAAQEADLRVELLEYVDSSPQLVRIPPLMILEILLIRTLRRSRLAARRACIIAAFRKGRR